MAQHKSAMKRIKQTIVRNKRNNFYRTRIKNIVKAVNTAVEAGNKEEALAKLKVANKKLHSFVTIGILKKGTASRKVSRLHKLVNSMAA